MPLRAPDPLADLAKYSAFPSVFTYPLFGGQATLTTMNARQRVPELNEVDHRP